MARRAAVLVLVSLAVLFPTQAFADGLADVTKRGEILWGGDQEGGGPYVYPRDDDASIVTGFEVDLAGAMGRRIGVRATFTQAQWDKLPEMLEAHKIDVVQNGYELTPAREEAMNASIPYYAYALALLTRKDDARIAAWEDLSRAPGGARLRIGVLTGSAAETYAHELCERGCDVDSYDGNTDTMREVETGKLYATVEDTPIASFYASRFPALHSIGEPRRGGYYVAYVPKGDEALTRALNESIVDIALSGELERIDRAYGIWDDRQKEILDIAKSARFYGVGRTEAKGDAPTSTEDKSLGERKRGFAVVKAYGGIMLKSAGLTVLLSLLSFPIAMALGLAVALGRLYGPRFLRAPLAAYVEFLRGTPVMLQLYFVFFFLPEVGINVPALATAIIGLAVNYSAYESENLSSWPPSRFQRTNGSRALARHVTESRAATNHRSAGHSTRHPSGGERLHRALQGHERLLGHHARRAHEKVQRAFAIHAGDDRVDGHDGGALPSHELSDVARRPARRAFARARGARLTPRPTRRGPR